MDDGKEKSPVPGPSGILRANPTIRKRKKGSPLLGSSRESSPSSSTSSTPKVQKKKTESPVPDYIHQIKRGVAINIQDLDDQEIRNLLKAFSFDKEWESPSSSEDEASVGDSPGNFPPQVYEPRISLEGSKNGSSSLPEGHLDRPKIDLASQCPVPLQRPREPPVKSLGNPKIPPIPFIGHNSLLVAPNDQTPLDYFELLFNEEFFNLVLSETEVFAEELFLKNISPRGRITDWNNLSKDEFRVWLALTFHMGHIWIPRIEKYWSTSPLYNIGIFRNNMSRDRYFGILQAVHFGRNPTPGEPLPSDRLFKFRPLVDFFNRRMREIFSPGKNLSLDESMVLWRGRLKFRQFIQGKKHKYGIKLYMLSDLNGLVLRFIVYEGAGDKNLSGPGHVEKVVHHLLDDFTYKGHSIFLDSFYNSIIASRRDNPPEVINAKLDRREVVHRWSEEGVCVFKWKDKREVNFISTEFGPEIVEIPGRRSILHKPKAVSEYNKNMGGVEKVDQILSYYDCEHKSLKWYKKLGIQIFQIMILNSYHLYSRFSGQSRLNYHNFRHEIVGKILNVSEVSVPSRTAPKLKKRPHYLKYTEDLEKNKKYKLQKRCVVCLQKGERRMVRTVCRQCDGEPGFCLGCFEKHHTEVLNL